MVPVLKGTLSANHVSINEGWGDGFAYGLWKPTDDRQA